MSGPNHNPSPSTPTGSTTRPRSSSTPPSNNRHTALLARTTPRDPSRSTWSTPFGRAIPDLDIYTSPTTPPGSDWIYVPRPGFDRGRIGTLPPELRNEIYALVFAASGPARVTGAGTGKKRTPQHALTGTAAWIRDECLGLYYEATVFEICVHRSWDQRTKLQQRRLLVEWKNSLRQADLLAIRAIRGYVVPRDRDYEGTSFPEHRWLSFDMRDPNPNVRSEMFLASGIRRRKWVAHSVAGEVLTLAVSRMVQNMRQMVEFNMDEFHRPMTRIKSHRMCLLHVFDRGVRVSATWG